jgi:hypothetical protein
MASNDRNRNSVVQWMAGAFVTRFSLRVYLFRCSIPDTPGELEHRCCPRGASRDRISLTARSRCGYGPHSDAGGECDVPLAASGCSTDCPSTAESVFRSRQGQPRQGQVIPSWIRHYISVELFVSEQQGLRVYLSRKRTGNPRDKVDNLLGKDARRRRSNLFSSVL